MIIRSHTRLLLGVCSIAMSSAALAQTQAPTPASDVAPEANDTGEIIVTAQRRAERLQDVPLSVTAVNEETLRERGVTNLSQLSQAAPSLQVSGENRFTVRGVGTLAFQSSLETSVAVAQDEVNLVSGILGSPVGTLFDVAQVEVLSGPQGLLFGKNASAGLLNVVTRRPEIGKLGAAFQVEGVSRPTSPDNGGGVNAQATLNLPVTSNSALRINTVYSYQEPIIKFIGSGRGDFGLKQYGVRAKYLIDITDALSLYVIGDYNEEHGIATFFDRPYSLLAAASPATPRNTALGIVPGPENLTVAGNGDFYRDAKRGGIQGKVSYMTPSGWEISNIAAWKAAKLNQNFDTDYTNANGADINQSAIKYHQFTNEFRVALPANGRFTGQAGLFFYSGNTDLTGALYGNNFVPAPALPGFPFCVGATSIGTNPGQCRRSNIAFLGQDRAYELNSKSYAAFGQFTYELIDGLKVIAGGRVTHDKLDIDLAQHQGAYFVTLGVPLVTQQETSNTNFSYRLGAQYNFTRDIMLYGTLGRGYKGPGFAENVAALNASAVVQPEINNNLEAGLKTSWLDRRLTVNVTAFRSKFENLQVSSFDPVRGSTLIQNAASSTSKGIEIATGYRAARGLSFNAAATFLDSKFNDFPGAECYFGQQTPSCLVATGRQFNAGGLSTPVSPKFVGTGQVQYEWALSTGVDAFIEGNAVHRSSQWFTINHTPGTLLGENTTYGGSIGIRTDSGVRVSLFCRNCTDERIPTNISIDAGEANNGPRIGLGQLFGFNSFRQIGVNFGFEF